MEKYKDIIIKYLVKEIDPYFIIVFGSVARGEMTKDSDIDVAFLSDKQYDEYNIYMCAQRLADKIGREIDLVDLSKASTVFRVQIIGKGKIIYNSEPTRSAIFKMKSLKEYALLNEERQCILDKVKERGQIYAR